MLRYRVFSSEAYSRYIGRYTGYGIEGLCPDGTAAVRLEDISEDKEYVEIIAEMLNKGGAEAVHFMDIVEDIMN